MNKVFDKDSGLVQLWVSIIQSTENNYTISDVPNISNLRDEVQNIITPTEE